MAEDRCLHVEHMPWGLSQCALGTGHWGNRHAYFPDEVIENQEHEDWRPFEVFDESREG